MLLQSLQEGSVMSSAPTRCAKSARKTIPITARATSASDKQASVGADAPVFLPAPAPGATESETVSTQASARTRLAYGLLKASMNEAATSIGFATGWWAIHAHTIESVHASALAAVQLVEALNRAERLKEVAAAQFTYSRRQRDAVDRQIVEFLAAARNMISVLTEPPSDSMVDCSKAGKCPSAPCNPQSVVERLRTLTQRQRRVLELMADGLPNKLIAHELGLCETTVKAHVSEILRKLCVYNRARAIVLLANIDLTSIFLPDTSILLPVADSKLGG